MTQEVNEFLFERLELNDFDIAIENRRHESYYNDHASRDISYLAENNDRQKSNVETRNKSEVLITQLPKFNEIDERNVEFAKGQNAEGDSLDESTPSIAEDEVVCYTEERLRSVSERCKRMLLDLESESVPTKRYIRYRSTEVHGILKTEVKDLSKKRSTCVREDNVNSKDYSFRSIGLPVSSRKYQTNEFSSKRNELKAVRRNNEK